MADAEQVFGIADRTPGGSLRARDVQLIANQLRRRWFVLLPSDTAYSIAVQPKGEQSRKFVNRLLGRDDIPVSLAFPSAPAARPYVLTSLTAEAIIDTFCPGPVTVVCPARPGRLPGNFFAKAIAVQDDTIGVRVPDSTIEREIAGCTELPITTVAVRDAKGNVVTSFDQAMAIVRAGLSRTGHVDWYAIEGNRFYAHHSTVIRVEGSTISLLREGDIPFERILEVVRHLPAAALDD